MTDTLSIQERSEVMSHVRSYENRSTELKLISIFRELGISGWRRKQKIFGKADFVFRSRKLCVFIDGCFWHGCSTCYRRPASNQAYWDSKVRRNKMRDREVNRVLRAKGWRILRIWEHQLGAKNRLNLIRQFRRHSLIAGHIEK